MSTELSLTIIAISLLVLVVFSIAALIYAIRLLVVLRKTTQTIEGKVNPLLDEARHVVNLTSGAAESLKHNLELTTPLFHSLGKISTLFDRLPKAFTNDMHDNTMNIHFGPKKGKIDVGDWAEWLALGITLVQKLRK